MCRRRANTYEERGKNESFKKKRKKRPFSLSYFDSHSMVSRSDLYEVVFFFLEKAVLK